MSYQTKPAAHYNLLEYKPLNAVWNVASHFSSTHSLEYHHLLTKTLLKRNHKRFHLRTTDDEDRFQHLDLLPVNFDLLQQE
jgi:hypothetical protein